MATYAFPPSAAQISRKSNALLSFVDLRGYTRTDLSAEISTFHRGEAERSCRCARRSGALALSFSSCPS